LKGGQKGLVTPLNLGWWEIVASNFPVEKTKFRVTMSNRHVVTIPSGGAIELKRIPYPENEQPLSNHLILEFFRNIYSLNVIQPSQAIIFSEEYYVANLSQLGQVEFQEKRIHFGFTEGWLYLLGNISHIYSIVLESHTTEYFKIEQPSLQVGFKERIGLDLEKLGIDGSNTNKLYLELGPGQYAQIHIPK
jgi:hypothetical protein